MTKRPTQADVARLAGVSRATVSYVLNARTDGRIPITEETQQRVQKAAQELGYEPNALARSLRSGLSRVIGLMIPDIRNPHYLDILAGVEDEIIARDYYLLLVSVDLDPERERHCLRSLFQQRLDGLILTPTFADLFEDEIQGLIDSNNPVVFVTPRDDADCVYPDVKGGAEALMDHLTSLGHRRIAFINGVARRDMAKTRLQVYRSRIAALGMTVDEQLIRNCGHLIQDGYFAGSDLLDLAHPPTAIWAVNDLLAIGALRAIRERGLCVPEDVSLAGYDNIALSAQLYPALTTVDMHGSELGRRAARVLFQHLEDPDRELIAEKIGTDLIVRQSTGPPRQSKCGPSQSGMPRDYAGRPTTVADRR